MSIGFESDPPALESLSALSDGELDSSEVARACGAWRGDPAVRSTWHAYQLIGDVLRSSDLACDPRRDAAFIAALRQRLADEPTVLAPESPSSPATPSARPDARGVAGAVRGNRWSWMAPSAVAAGFVLVASALIVTRTPPPQAVSNNSSLARAGAERAAPPITTARALADEHTAATPPMLRINGRVIRDPRLDSYLAAHQQFAGSTALGVPSGFLRNAAVDMPTR